MAKTTNRGFGLDFLGHVPTEQLLVANFKMLDTILGPEPEEPTEPVVTLPPFTAADIGKTLGVVDDGDGNAVLGWVAAAP